MMSEILSGSGYRSTNADGARGCLGYDRLEKATWVKDRWKEKEMNNGSTNRAAQPREALVGAYLPIRGVRRGRCALA